MRHLALNSLLVFMVTCSVGCVVSRSDSSPVAILRRDAAAELKQLTERSAETEMKKETSSELVQASFTMETDGDAAAFLIEIDEEPEQPQWWTTVETEDQSFEETTLSANSMTDVTASNPTDSRKPTQGWTATRTR